MTYDSFMFLQYIGMDAENKKFKNLLINLKLYQEENPHAWQAAVSGI